MTALTRALGRGHTWKLAVGAVLFAATLAIAVGPALAAAPAVFRNIPTTLPGNVSSEAFQAQRANEFGDRILLAAGDRSSANLPVTVVMSIWACQTGGGATCATTPGATWNQELTLKLYSVKIVGGTPATDAVLLTKTQTFALPFRPSYVADGSCVPDLVNHLYPWYSAAETTCFNGLAHPVTFDLPADVTLPDELIWGIAFNTSNSGYSPIGGTGGPYDSLNVGMKTFPGQPSVGTDVEPGSVFLSLTQLGVIGPFRDVTGWTGLAPLACFGTCPINLAAAPATSPPPTSPPPTSPPPTSPPPPTPIESFAGATAVASASASAAPTPIESVAGATAVASASASATPVEVVAAATGTPHSATPPPTNSNSPSDGGSSGLLALLISLGFGAVGLFAVGAQRRTMRR
jgi:hypothetical protein